MTGRHGILSLLEKQNKDALLVKLWRPLTLLNTDNKIYGKILANRLTLALDEIIHYNQMGFIKRRHAAENIKIMELMNKLETELEDNLLINKL